MIPIVAIPRPEHRLAPYLLLQQRLVLEQLWSLGVPGLQRGTKKRPAKHTHKHIMQRKNPYTLQRTQHSYKAVRLALCLPLDGRVFWKHHHRVVQPNPTTVMSLSSPAAGHRTTLDDDDGERDSGGVEMWAKSQRRTWLCHSACVLTLWPQSQP